MQIHESTKAIVCSVATVILLLLGSYTGVLYQVSLFMAVCPVAILYVSTQKKTIWISYTAIVLLYGILTLNPAQLIHCILFVIVPGIIVGILLKQKAEILKIFSALTVLYLLSFYVQIWLYATVAGQDAASFLQEAFYKSIDISIDTYRQALGSSFADVEHIIVPAFHEMKKTLLIYLPAITIITCGTFALISLIIIGTILKKLKYLVITPVFSHLRYNKLTAVVYFIIVIISMMQSNNSTSKIVLDNAYIIITFAFSIAGLSIIKYYINKIKIATGVKSFLFTILIFILFPLYQMIAVVGLLDCFMNFRARSSNSSI